MPLCHHVGDCDCELVAMDRPLLLGDRVIYVPWAAHGRVTLSSSESLGSEVTLYLDSDLTLLAPRGDVMHESDLPPDDADCGPLCTDDRCDDSHHNFLPPFSITT